MFRYLKKRNDTVTSVIRLIVTYNSVYCFYLSDVSDFHIACPTPLLVHFSRNQTGKHIQNEVI